MNKVVQLFWGCFFDYVFIPFETSNVDQFLFQKRYNFNDLYQYDKLNHQLISGVLLHDYGDGFHAIWHEIFIYLLPC